MKSPKARSHARIQKVLSEGSNADNVFFLILLFLFDGMERGSKCH